MSAGVDVSGMTEREQLGEVARILSEAVEVLLKIAEGGK